MVGLRGFEPQQDIHNMVDELWKLPVSSTKFTDVIQEVGFQILIDEVDGLRSLANVDCAVVMMLVVDEGLDRRSREKVMVYCFREVPYVCQTTLPVYT